MNTFTSIVRCSFVAIAAASMLLAPASNALAYDATADFATLSNPNSVWSYGSLETVNDPSFMLFNTLTTSDSSNPLGATGTLVTWSGSTSHPLVGKAGVSGFNYSTLAVASNALHLHPGNSTENYAVVRFAAPISSSYQFSGSFWGQDNYAGETDVHVIKGGASLFNADLIGPNAPTKTFAGVVSLTAGETLSFAVGRGTGNHSHDSTGLSASVMAVPEPHSVVLVLAGLAAMVVVAKRRKSQS